MSALTLGLGLWSVAATAGAWWRLRRRMEQVARATHELRAPLCAARLAAHAGRREPGGGALEAVDRELARAALLLGDLDAIREGRAVDQADERVDVGALLRAAARTWSPLAWPTGRELRVEVGGVLPPVRGDRQRLEQAVGNLIANALRHGAGAVVVRARSWSGELHVEVEDAGPGLPRALPALRRRARAGRGAHGRGLAIAGAIVRRHGGRLRAEPLDGGCRIVLTLPTAAARDARQGPSRWHGVRVGGIARPWRTAG